MRNKILSWILTMGTVLLIFGAMPLISYSFPTPDYVFDVSEGNINIGDGTSENTYKVVYGNPQTEEDNIPQSQIITLTGTAETNTVTVSATEGTVKIMLSNMNISKGMRLESSETRDVEIILADDTTNIIRNSLSNASPDTGGGLTITCEHSEEPGHVCDEHCGSLNVYGPSGNGAGISGHNITIKGGNIYAKGGNSSPGIGKYAFYGTVKNLRFYGGNITAEGTGGYGAAGIGGGDCTNADGIYINGGIIKAKGGGSGPGIGGGQMFYGSGGQAHNIIINSGTVFASGYYASSYAIGGTGTCSNIQINGGSVNAGSIKIQPVNASSVEVYRTIITLGWINSVTRVTDIEITGADYYNISDIFTDAAGKIYLYLPEGAAITDVTAGGITYSGSITTTNDGLAAETFYETTAPVLTAGTSERISENTASVKFTSDEAGEYYYQVLTSGSPEPAVDTSGTGTACDTSEQTIQLNTLTAEAKDIYILVKDISGNVSNPLKITIPEYAPQAPAITNQPEDVNTTYADVNDSLSVTAAITDGGSLSYQWYSNSSDSNQNGTLISGAVDAEYTLPEDLPAGTYYYYCAVKNSFDTGQFTAAASDTATVTVNKAEPAYTTPAGLSATYGDTLSDVQLPQGFSWENNLDTQVGNVGTNSFTVSYTPQDTNNYLVITGINITIEVSKAEPAYTTPAGLSATYGDTLSDVQLPQGFSWENNLDTQVGNVGTNSFMVSYTPQDTDNYLVVTGINITIEVSKAETIINFQPEDDTSGINLSGLEDKVNIPEKEQDDVEIVTLSVTVEEADNNASNFAVIEDGEEALAEEGYSLLKAFNISIIKRIQKLDGTTTESPVPNSDITGLITVRIPVTDELENKTNLSIAYIDDQGNIEILKTKRVTIAGIDYLEFETDHFSAYAVVEMTNDLPQTVIGAKSISFTLILLLAITAGSLIVKIKANKA